MSPSDLPSLDAQMTKELDRYMPINADLLPCPFCGEKAVLTNVRESGHSFAVGCVNESCWRPRTDYYDQQEHVVSAWNTRAALTVGAEPPQQASSKHTSQCIEIALMLGQAGFPEDVPIQDAVRQLIAERAAVGAERGPQEPPNELYRKWAAERAAEFGEDARDMIEACRTVNDNGINAGVAWAREAAHFGRIALEAAGVPSQKSKADIEQDVIDHCVVHWFTQGGSAQFGDIPCSSVQNADELISAILSRVRAAGVPSPPPELERPRAGDLIEAGAALEKELREQVPSFPLASFVVRGVLERHLAKAMLWAPSSPSAGWQKRIEDLKARVTKAGFPHSPSSQDFISVNDVLDMLDELALPLPLEGK